MLLASITGTCRIVVLLQLSFQLAFHQLHKQIVKTYEPSTGRWALQTHCMYGCILWKETQHRNIMNGSQEVCYREYEQPRSQKRFSTCSYSLICNSTHPWTNLQLTIHYFAKSSVICDNRDSSRVQIEINEMAVTWSENVRDGIYILVTTCKPV